VALGRWLSECGGCGMCEASCSQGVPLFLLITALSHRIRHEMDYTGDVHVLPTLN
jgi:hypothetical protein